MPFSKSNLWSIDWRNCLFSCAEIVLHCRWDLPLDTGFGGRATANMPLAGWGRGDIAFDSGQTHIAVSAQLNLIRLQQNNSGQTVIKKVTMRMEEECQTRGRWNLPPIKPSAFGEPWRAQAEPSKYVLLSPFTKIIKLPHIVQFELNTASRLSLGDRVCNSTTGGGWLPPKLVQKLEFNMQ